MARVLSYQLIWKPELSQQGTQTLDTCKPEEKFHQQQSHDLGSKTDQENMQPTLH